MGKSHTRVSGTDISDGFIFIDHSPEYLLVLELGVAHIQVNILQYLGLAVVSGGQCLG